MLDATVFSTCSSQAMARAFGFANDLGLKSLVLCAAALALDRALRGRVLARSAVLHACLLGLALLPAAALIFPEVKLKFNRERAVAASPPFSLQQRDLSPSEYRPASERRMRIAEREAGKTPPELQVATLAPSTAARAANHESQNNEAAAPAARQLSWPAVVLFVYAVVAVGALFRLSLSLAAVARLKRSGAPLTQQVWNERLAHWRVRLGVARPVQLRLTDRVDVPVVVGWRRPAILAPQQLAEVDMKTIDAVLLHELAHVRRADYGWNLLLRLMQALYWPNPLLWLVGRAMGRVREQACDELCIYWLGDAKTYRATLLELAGGLLRRPLAALGMAMAGSSRLQRRLEQIDASRGRAECQSRWTWRFATLAVVVSLAGALGALRITSRAAAEPPARTDVATDKSELSRDRENAAPAVAKEAAADPNTPEPSAPAKPAAESKDEKAPRPEKPIPSKAADEGAPEAAADEPAEPIKVRVEKVRREDFVVQTSQMGTLKPSRSMELYARVAGLIVDRQVNVGDLVKAGQVLAEIDAPELDAELEQAKALAEEAPAAVEQAQGKLDEASAGLEGAQARVVKSEAELSRAMRNREESIPVAKAQLAAAKAEVKQAEAAVAVAKAGLRIAELQRDAALRHLERVTQQAKFRQIAASADGLVMRQAAEPGSFAKLGGESLFVISSTDIVTMQTQIPERDALRVELGQHVRVWLDAERNGNPHDAKVSRVGYAIDTKTQSMLVEIDLPNADGRLRPGMHGGAVIDLETHPGVLTMPRRIPSGRDEHNAPYCYRVIEGRAVKTTFTANFSVGERGEVLTGLSEGDFVVVDTIPRREFPFDLDGKRVEIITEKQ